MKAYSIFDDFPQSAVSILEHEGVAITVHPKGKQRPDCGELKAILEEYDIVIIGTGQKMPEAMFENINTMKIIGTASIGMDHIHVPQEKKDFIYTVNAPTANRISVAEHTFALILALKKMLKSGNQTALQGLSKKAMKYTPTDLYGSVIGVVGAGGTASAVIRMAQVLGMRCICWTRNPGNHSDLQGVEYVSMEQLARESDIISVNIPLTDETKGLISRKLIADMKDNAIFVSLSRAEVVDNQALFDKARKVPTFQVGLDADAEQFLGLWDNSMENVIVTPHIGGGTVQSRIRLFEEVSGNILKYL